MTPIVIYNKPQIFAAAAEEAFVPQTVSLDLDGSTENLLKTGVSVGIEDSWTIAVWAKPDTTAAVQQLVNIWDKASSPTEANKIQIHTLSGGGIRVRFRGANGAPTDTEGLPVWNSAASNGVWAHHLFVWDGTDLSYYLDGSDQGAPDSGDNSPGFSMSDTPVRDVSIGSQPPTVTQWWPGNIHSVAIWNTDVTAAVSDIYAAGDPTNVNLNSSFGSYSFAGNLAHWWRLGVDSGDIGKDFSTAGFTPTINVGDDASNIDAGDIVADVP